MLSDEELRAIEERHTSDKIEWLRSEYPAALSQIDYDVGALLAEVKRLRKGWGDLVCSDYCGSRGHTKLCVELNGTKPSELSGA